MAYIDLKCRNAVGGLISLVGIVIVFGVASFAFLDINTEHVKFVNTSVTLNEKISDKNSEHLNFTSISKPTSTTYQVTVENIGNQKSTFNSYVIIKNDDSVDGFGYDDDIISGTSSIKTGSTESFTISNENISANDKSILLTTNTGKLCVMPASLSGNGRVC